MIRFSTWCAALAFAFSFFCSATLVHANESNSDEAKELKTVTPMRSEEINNHEKENKSAKGEPSNFGPGKGVISANEKDGIKLTEGALRTLGIVSRPLRMSNPVLVPTKALVFFQNEVGVYRLRNGWFKLIEGTLSKRTASEAVFESKGLLSSDQIVVEGAPLLRLTDLNVWSGAGDGDAD